MEKYDREIEDLTRVVISYEMTTSVRFCLSYDRYKLDFVVFKLDIMYRRKSSYLSIPEK